MDLSRNRVVPAAPRLVAIADRGAADSDETWWRWIESLAAALAHRPDCVVQVRAKALTGEARRDALAEARRRAHRLVPTVLSGTTDEAVALGYDGVHWTEAELERNEAVGNTASRRPEIPVSASVHSYAALRGAEGLGVWYAVYGPVFAPISKAGTGVGTGALALLARASELPLVAIGGVTPENAGSCFAAGAHGVAAIGTIFGHRRPDLAALTLYAACREGRPRSATHEGESDVSSKPGSSSVSE